MTTDIDLFVEEARGISIGDAAVRLGLTFKRGSGAEHPQPCPACGGKDTFSFNTEKNAWNCRRGGVGGKDAIGMAAHAHGLDLNRRDGFLGACELVTGRAIPDGEERESDDDRAARLDRLERQRRQNETEAGRRADEQSDFREKERRKARGIHDGASVLGRSDPVIRYMGVRGSPHVDRRWLRFAPSLTYWHGSDERGDPAALFSGPAMVAGFYGPGMELIGCHITWIDLDRGPKFRPDLFGLTKDGVQARRPGWAYGDPPPSPEDLAAGLYERLPTKKMRGSKNGGLIPIAGDPAAARWVGGEGIENGSAFGCWEGLRDDTFYFAAGDLGNLAGPAEASSRFAHPTLKKPDKKGVLRSVMVPGPVPKRREAESGAARKPDRASGGQPAPSEGQRADASDAARETDQSMWIGAHVRELVLLGDGDSEPVFTATAMARAKARMAAPERQIFTAWPKAGTDFAGMAAGLT